MKFIILAPDYTGSCVQNEFGDEILIENLGIPDFLIQKINAWHEKYRKIIPLSKDERLRKTNEIERLDNEGLLIAKKLKSLIPGGAKIKYFSEGKLRYLEAS